jgi:hypothetical protein
VSRNAPMAESLDGLGCAVEADQQSRCAINLYRAEALSIYVYDESNI